MNVLVVGGSGFIGTNLSRELNERGHDVTVLSRDPEGEGLPAGVDAVSGDVTAYDSIEGAFEGMDAVVYLVALSPLFKPKGGNEKHFEIHTEGTRHVVQAAEEHGVDRFVHMSALGADPDGPTAYIQAKGQAEDIVTGSELDWVIFRPSVVFGEGGEFVSFTKKLTPPGLAPLPGGGKKTNFQPIWVGDLVPMLADAMEDDDHVGETYEIGGPEVLSLREIAKMVRGSVILPVPMGLAGVGLKVAGSIPGFPMGGDQYRSLQFDNTTSDNDVATFGVDRQELTTLGEYLDSRA
ncbi:complex I NDUFA9 subunit family protein [Halorientalis pallida]|uniref:Complex I NDUFA9 subunit family protein n=1 Tax=Halorientalis pallida TaxID=2479928 RepID=A0A498L881_9EURY|nr:complex I NDUFA9 subunit family protein [Halorientalis pallida]RXK51985.1 complex I NDUFA9 subunit family protein [Halorientalis pallida]